MSDCDSLMWKVKGLGAWPAKLSWRVPPRKVGHSSFVWFPLLIWCSSDWKRSFCWPRFAHRTGTGVEVCRRAKSCFGNLYFLNLVLVICATYSASAPQGQTPSMSVFRYGEQTKARRTFVYSRTSPR
jgi:hypothetical protein